MPDITIEELARKAIETIDARQNFYKAANQGLNAVKKDAQARFLKLEKELREMAGSVLHKQQAAQTNLF